MRTARFPPPGVDLGDAIARLIIVSRPETVQEALDALGSNQDAASFFAGTENRRTPAWRAALRRVQRYRAGPGRERRQPQGEDRARLLRVARRRVTIGRRFFLDGTGLTIRARFVIRSAKRKTDDRKRTIRGELSGEAWGEVIDSYVTTGRGEAASAFEWAFGTENLGGTIAEISEVELLQAT